jgi:hypothetical protein
MVVNPKKAYSEFLRTAADKKRGDSDFNVWQSPLLFINICSSSGCVFDFTAGFLLDEVFEERKDKIT